MQVDSKKEAIPWRFTKEEAALIKDMLANPVMQAYLSSLLYMAMDAKVLPAESSEDDLRASNAYVAGQEQVINALKSQDGVYIPLIKEK